MKGKRCVGLALALVIAVNSLGTTSFAAETQEQREPISAIERASGNFNETVSAGKVKKLGSAISLAEGELVKFTATYSPRSASVDFGVVDSDNVFIYITASKGSVDGSVAIAESVSYTPAIRNNSDSSITVTGNVMTGPASW